MANTYYVATNGNDSSDGSEQKPFRTIKKGISILAAGDTLLIKNGTYVEEIDVSKSGTASAPLTIKAYPGQQPIIDGQAGVNGINGGLPAGPLGPVNPNNGAGAKYTGLFNISGSHIVVEGLEVMRSMGRGIRVYSPQNQKIENITIRDCTVHHSRGSNILFHGSKSGSDVTVGYVKIEGCDLSWGGNFYPGRRDPAVANWPGCLTFRSVKYGEVRNCVIHEHWGEKILLDSNDGGSHHFVIEDNVFYDCMNSAYLHAVSDVVFQRNYIYRSSTDKASSNPFGPTNAVAVSPAEQPWMEQIPSNNIKILNNIIVGTGRGLGIRATAEKAGINNVVVAYNTIINPSVVGVNVPAVNKKNMTFRNNIVYSATGVQLVNDGGQTNSNWTFSNNMWSSKPKALNGPNDVIGNPQFRNVSGFPAAGKGDPKDYQVRPGSPAIDAGYKLDEPKDDFFKNLRVGTPDIGGYEQVDTDFIEADFEATPAIGTAPLAVTFQDLSSSSAAITEWFWEFGDGTVSGQQNPTHVFNSGSFTVSLRVNGSAGSDTVSKQGFITASPPAPTTPPRVTDGLQILYRFNEGSGRIVHDVSGEGTPLDLEIQDLAGINWLGQGLSIITPTTISSAIPAEKIYDTCHLTNEITVEAWLKPANTIQDGPARIVSISQNSHSRNVTLGQGLWGSLPSDLYDIRLRTTERSANGMPSFSSPPGTLTREKSHIVMTRSRTGAARIFRNGVQIAETVISGDFSTWNPRFPLLLANETTNDFPWLGDLYLVAVYDRALGTREVEQNYEAGTTSEGSASSELPVLLPIFKRFYIATGNGNTVQTSEKVYATFGVQYPDMRCVTCTSNGDQTLTVHDNINATLRSYGAKESELHWLD